jgi:hypothetical protein
MSEVAVLKQEPQSVVAPAAQSDGAAMISMLERAARDPAVDIEKFERLMTMKERVESQANMRAFNAAVSLAKGSIPPIFKNKVVDFTSQKGRTNYRHEDFAEVARAVDPVLKNADGHFEETTLEVAEDHTGNKNAIQAIGSAATYLQRYTLKLALGLSASADDDGKSSTAPAVISDEQADALTKALTDTQSDVVKFLAYFKAESVSDLLAKDFDRAMSALNKKANQ